MKFAVWGVLGLVACGPPSRLAGPEHAGGEDECADLETEGDRLACRAMRGTVQDLTGGAADDPSSLPEALVLALARGESTVPEERDGALRLHVSRMPAESPGDAADAAIAVLLRTRGAAAAGGAAAEVDARVPSRLRRRVLARAALLGHLAADPDAGEPEAHPLAAFERFLRAVDPEVRIVALSAVIGALRIAAGLEGASDPNPVVQAVEAAAGDRVRLAFSLAGRRLDPLRLDESLPPAARGAGGEPELLRRLALFERLEGWRVPAGDLVGARARVLGLFEARAGAGVEDDAAVRTLEAAARAVDLAESAERAAEEAIPCVEAAGADWGEGFPRTVAAFRRLAAAAAPLGCLPDGLALGVEDLADACGAIDDPDVAEVLAVHCGE